ncbi:DNA-binding protein [Bifidobacterium dolichotidis]|uniref:DNA-binding protein n=2 Tax=Bifidobacterium dolichotidis TaxID=2306976 RepID=A0A430FSF4_9BIFI|nr:septation protein SepH [Bifidobacterium dolichotidis]RSX55789.1 DNA-binding protein [Bifidobacterium dolichotidis]
MGSDTPKARFDRVTDDGELEFSMGTQTFLIEVNDVLDRAILTAKQIQSDHIGEKPVNHTQTIPISQIQQLIRAGLDPHTVAERYNMDEALVRRFSQTVEREKNYAIQQFLNVAAPKESKVRTISEIIERTLAAIRVDRSQVHWSATRRALEPWHITATFTAGNHEIRAEWSWSAHNNAVTCLNSAARTLLGEQSEPVEPLLDEVDTMLKEAVSSSAQLPGDSARSARIELAVSSWTQQNDAPAEAAAQQLAQQSVQAAQSVDTPAIAAPQQAAALPASNTVASASTDTVELAATTPAVTQPQDAPANLSNADEQSEESSTNADNNADDAAAQDEQSVIAMRQMLDASADRAAENHVEQQAAPVSSDDAPTQDNLQQQPVSDTSAATEATTEPAATPAADQSTEQQAATPATTEHPEVHATPATVAEKVKHRPGRAHMPSWDEILFGGGE